MPPGQIGRNVFSDRFRSPRITIYFGPVRFGNLVCFPVTPLCGAIRKFLFPIILIANVTADGFPAAVFLPAPLPQGIVAQRVPEGMEIQGRNAFIISRTVIGGSVRKTDRKCYVQPTGVKIIEKKPLPPGFLPGHTPLQKSGTTAVCSKFPFGRRSMSDVRAPEQSFFLSGVLQTGLFASPDAPFRDVSRCGSAFRLLFHGAAGCLSDTPFLRLPLFRFVLLKKPLRNFCRFRPPEHSGPSFLYFLFLKNAACYSFKG